MKVLNMQHYSNQKNHHERNHTFRELDLPELEGIEGGAGAAAAGALLGAGFNAYQYIGSGSPNGFKGFLLAAGSGAIGGAIAATSGLGFMFYGGAMSTVGGMAAGRSWHGGVSTVGSMAAGGSW